MSRLTDLLGLEHTVVQGPFGGGLSTVALAVAVSEAGGLGSYGAHILDPDAITALIGDLASATSKPFNVNLWVPQDEESVAVDLAEHVERLRPLYDRLGVEWDGRPLEVPAFESQLEAALEAAPPVLSFVMGIPPQWAISRAHAAGIVLIGTATTVDEARAIEAAGLDVVVASGSDAGGHRGTFLRPVRESLVGTFSLVPQVADAVAIPVVAAGGIIDARGVRAALALGADGVQIGTGFLATAESGVSAGHRALLGTPAAETTILTRLFSGRPARGIPNRLTAELAHAEDQVPPYPIQNALMRPLRAAVAARGGTEWTNLWAGQAAALAPGGSAADYVATLT